MNKREQANQEQNQRINEHKAILRREYLNKKAANYVEASILLNDIKIDIGIVRQKISRIISILAEHDIYPVIKSRYTNWILFLAESIIDAATYASNRLYNEGQKIDEEIKEE